MECVFACDVGTSACKTALISENGSFVTHNRFQFSKNTSAVQWLETLHKALHINENFAFQNKIKISAICISGNGPTLVSVSDGSAKVTDRLFLWNEKSSGLNLSEKEQEILEKLKVSGSIFLPRVFSFLKKYPKDFFTAKYLFSGAEYLAYKLTGNAVTFLPEPRYKKAYWSAETIKTIFSGKGENIVERLLKILPAFVLSGSIIGTYKDSVVVAGAPDFFVALLGTKTFTPFSACNRAGTSEGINVCLAQKPKSQCSLKSFRVLPSVFEPNWNISFLLGQTGVLSKKVASFEYKKNLGDLLKKHPDIESYITQFKTAVKNLEAIAGKELQFTLTGGQSENERLNQIKADISNRSFWLTQTSDCELLGDAILAFSALKFFPSLKIASDQLVRLTKSFEPRL